MNSVISNHTRDHEVGSSVEWPSMRDKGGFFLATGGSVTSENGEVECRVLVCSLCFCLIVFALFIKTSMHTLMFYMKSYSEQFSLIFKTP